MTGKIYIISYDLSKADSDMYIKCNNRILEFFDSGEILNKEKLPSTTILTKSNSYRTRGNVEKIKNDLVEYLKKIYLVKNLIIAEIDPDNYASK